MKKTLLTLSICLLFTTLARAQFGPSPDLNFGVKGGFTVAASPAYGIYTNTSQAGYIGGFWATMNISDAVFFQPEVYIAQKGFDVADDKGNTNQVRFMSVDVPLLFGGKINALGLDGRLYTGPVVSYGIKNTQSFAGADEPIVTLSNYKKLNYAWQVGGGIDVEEFSIDLRYEGGINKLAYGPRQWSHTRINVITLTLAYRLFSF